MIGLVCGIIILVIEMILFIMRAVQIEDNMEKPLTGQKSSLAKFRSGALAPDPNFHPDQSFQPPANPEVDKMLFDATESDSIEDDKEEGVESKKNK